VVFGRGVESWKGFRDLGLNGQYSRHLRSLDLPYEGFFPTAKHDRLGLGTITQRDTDLITLILFGQFRFASNAASARKSSGKSGTGLVAAKRNGTMEIKAEDGAQRAIHKLVKGGNGQRVTETHFQSG
jgi:hypothetical protein